MGIRRSQGKDQAASTLNGAVSGSATTWTVTSAASFPTEGDFYIRCESEIVKVTAVSGNDFTVVRGQSGTANVSHNNGRDVVSIVTKEDIEARMNEAGMTVGMPFGKITAANGNVLTASDFTLINGTSSSVVDGNNGVVVLRCRNHSTDDMTGAVRSFGTGTDTDHYAYMSAPNIDSWPFLASTYSSFGMWFRQSTGGAMKGISLYPHLKIGAQTRATFLTDPVDVNWHSAEGRTAAYFKITVRWDVVASTDYVTAYYSWDGIDWVQLHQWQFAFGAYTLGLFARNAGQDGKVHHIQSWLQDSTV
jgi:hypothetical protein